MEAVEQPLWRSNIEDALQSWQNKGTAEQLRAHLSKTRGAMDEAEWIELDEFLNGKRSVTKAEVAEFVAANKVEVQEVVKGDREPPTQEQEKALLDQVREMNPNNVPVAFDALERLKASPGHSSSMLTLSRMGVWPEVLAPFVEFEEGKDATKFSRYQLPGGENYRELLLTLAVKEGEDLPPGYKAVYNQPKNTWGIEFPDGGVVDGWKTRDAAIRSQKSQPYNPVFQSSHFQELNILAHVRFNERTDVEGKRVLHLEEVQSDWHQKGRKDGYEDKDGETPKKNWFKTKAEIEAKYGMDLIGLRQNQYKDPTSEKASDLGRVDRAYADFQNQKHGLNPAVPAAPFKQTWPMLAMKRMIRYAADNGFDRISWTNGGTQAERYDLSKQADYISFTSWPAAGKDMGVLSVYKGESQIVKETVPESELAKYIGKEAAKKLVDAPKDPIAGERFIEGNDLKVGGNGLKGFYDEILPAEVNKYVKKWGGRVGQTALPEKKVEISPDQIEEMPNLDGSGSHFIAYGKDGYRFGSAWDTRAEAEKDLREHLGGIDAAQVHSLDITPAMREAALKGMPMFARGQNAGLSIEDATEVVHSVLETNGELPDRIRIIRDETASWGARIDDRNIITLNAAQISTPDRVSEVILEEGLHGVWNEPEVQRAWRSIRDLVTPEEMAAESKERKAQGLPADDDTIREEAAIARLIKADASRGFVIRLMDAVRSAFKRVFGFNLPGTSRQQLKDAAMEFLRGKDGWTGARGQFAFESGGVRYAKGDVENNMNIGTTVVWQDAGQSRSGVLVAVEDGKAFIESGAMTATGGVNLPELVEVEVSRIAEASANPEPVQAQAASVPPPPPSPSPAIVTPERVEAIYKELDPDRSWKSMSEKIAEMFNKRDVEGLRSWVMSGRGFNDSTKAVVFKLLGQKVPTNKEGIGRALDEWGGITPAQRSAMIEAKETARAKEEAARVLRGAEQSLKNMLVGISDGQTQSAKEWVDARFAEGFNKVVTGIRGVTGIHDGQRFYPLADRSMIRYARAKEAYDKFETITPAETAEVGQGGAVVEPQPLQSQAPQAEAPTTGAETPTAPVDAGSPNKNAAPVGETQPVEPLAPTPAVETLTGTKPAWQMTRQEFLDQARQEVERRIAEAQNIRDEAVKKSVLETLKYELESATTGQPAFVIRSGMEIGRGGQQEMSERKIVRADIGKAHRTIIEANQRIGNPIPAIVLDDYPDLKPKTEIAGSGVSPSPEPQADQAPTTVVETPPAPVFSDEYTGPRWTYGLRNRPMGIGAQPKGFIIGSEGPAVGRARHGTIQYPRELTADELYDFELELIANPQVETAQAQPPAPVAGNVPEQLEPSEIRLVEHFQKLLLKNVPITSRVLVGSAEKILVGNRRTTKEIYDFLELAVNLNILENPDFKLSASQNPADTIAKVAGLVNSLPTQTVRDREQQEFQQFSTPPHIGAAACWAAGIRPGDVVFEPSAGIGGLAVWAAKDGATVIVNELSERRRSLLRTFNWTVFGENAEQIHNILPDSVAPDVVLMNPPFSSTAGRISGATNSKNIYTHINQALLRLKVGGRLVAVVGEGLSLAAPSHREFWQDVASEYTLRTNVAIEGDEYRKYGTSFGVRVLVIDKTGPTKTMPLDASVQKPTDLIEFFNEIRKERYEHNRIANNPVESGRSQPAAVESISQGSVASPTTSTGREPSDVVSARGVGNQRGNAPATGRRGRRAGGTDDGRSKPLAGAGGTGGGLGTQEPTDAGRRDASGTGGGDLGTVSGGATGLTAENSTTASVTQTTKKAQADADNPDAVFNLYSPQILVEGAVPHPTALSESAAMGSVTFPPTSYKPKLLDGTVEKGVLTAAQLEAVVLAGSAHSKNLGSGERMGFFIGDGTGVGKGREISGVIMDNLLQGRKRHIWISEKSALITDAKRDLGDVGLNPGMVIDFASYSINDKLPDKDGILFLTYDTLKSVKIDGQVTRSRLEQVIAWAGEGFDGVLAFDEAHNMANATDGAKKSGPDAKKPSKKALAGIALQDRLTDARVLYVSATGATEVDNLAYTSRLGLWGEGTQFLKRQNFLNSISAGGVAAMELVARDMKAMGVYCARNLSFNGVGYERLEHTLTKDQEETYNILAEAWSVVQKNFQGALDVTQADGMAAMSANSQFWSANQRFWSQVVCSMQMPSIIASIQEDMKEGRSSVVQLVNTNEASLVRAVARAVETGESLESMDMTPRDQLMGLIESAFPTQQFEEKEDANGNVIRTPVFDSQGNPVRNKQALAMKEKLLKQVGIVAVPDGPLELLMNAFGHEAVAEVTGRTRRVVWKEVDGERKRVIESRTRKHGEHEANEFQAARRRVLVFSQAGGTGRSFHASRSVENRQKRKHYLAQSGWRADVAVQGFGRSHRSNQEQPPTYVLATTNLKAQKRFMSTIAKRLDQLGALTKGQRQAGSTGIFSSSDNLEGPLATEALSIFFRRIVSGKASSIDCETFENQTGLSIDTQELPKMSQFLNRLFSLRTDVQNKVFDEFEKCLVEVTEQHRAAGTLETGMETIVCEQAELASETPVFVDSKSGAVTNVSSFNLLRKRHFNEFELFNQKNFVVNKASGYVWAVVQKADSFDENQNRCVTYYLSSPDKHNTVQLKNDKEFNGKYQTIDLETARKMWADRIQQVGTSYKDDAILITGAVLPVWKSVSESTGKHVRRIVTSNGESFIGKVVFKDQVPRLESVFGVDFKTGETIKTMEVENWREAVFEEKKKIVLSNGWAIHASKVGFTDRVEVSGIGLSELDAFEKCYNAYSEIVSFRTRVFLYDHQFEEVAEKLVKTFPIAEIIETKSKGVRV